MTTAGVWDAIFAAARRAVEEHEAAQETRESRSVNANWWIGVGGGFVRVGWRRLVMWAAGTGRSNSPLHPLVLGAHRGNAEGGGLVGRLLLLPSMQAFPSNGARPYAIANCRPALPSLLPCTIEAL